MRPRTGNYATGERNGAAKLYAVDIPIIRRKLKEGKAVRAIAREFGVGRTAIKKIRDNETWRDV